MSARAGYHRRVVRRLALILAVLVACRPPTTPGATDGASTSTSSASGEGSSGTTDACMHSGDCDTDGICVADYAPGLEGGPGGVRGPAVCGDEGVCIGALDLTRWCFDHQGCCGDLRCRPADGVCEEAGLGVSTGTGTSSGGETGSSSGSGGSGGSGGSSGGTGGSGGTTADSTG